MNINAAEHREDRPWLEQTDLLGSISQVLLARKWSIVGITLLTFALTVLGTWLAQPVYTASASILLRKERFDAPVTPEQTLVTGQPDRHLTEEEVNSEVEILNSPSILEEVVRRDHLDQEFERSQGNQLLSALKQLLPNDGLTPQARAQIQLRNNLAIESVKKSNIIRVTYRAADRDQSAQVINTLCAVYQERHVRMRQNGGDKNFFAEQARAMRKTLDEKEAALRRVTPLPNSQLLNQQTETQIRQLNEFEAALAATRTALAESEARIKTLDRQLAAEPERLLSEERVAHHVAPDAMKAQLFALELRRTELLSKYQPGHRLVRDLEKDLEKARQLVAQTEALPSESVKVTSLNPLRQRLTDALASERSNFASLREKERMLAATVRQAEEKVRELGMRGYEQRRLDRERELADNAYQLYSRKSEEGRLSSALDEQGIINIQVAEPARAPFKATSPNVPLNLVLGLIGGLVAALAATFTLEYFNPTNKPRRPATPVGRVAPLASRAAGTVRMSRMEIMDVE
ncbi:MAG TPA: GumC family protein [Blastocatellia bacterium]|nr:GumC family protein [Blastocatellia bacterium]